jgi:hypothetical protein
MFQKPNAFYIEDTLGGLRDAPTGYSFTGNSDKFPSIHRGTKKETNAALALAGLRTSPIMTRWVPQKHIEGSLDGRLKDWGSTWSCKQ